MTTTTTPRESLLAELARIVAAVRIEGDQAIRIGDAVHPVVPGQIPAGTQSSGDPLVDTLQWRLYDAAYCRRFGDPAPAITEAIAEGDDLTELLSAANAARDGWNPGWTVRETMADGRFVLERGGAQRRAWAGEFLSRERPGTPPLPGTPVELYLPREARGMQPGFYFAFGETPGAELEDVLFVRFYWNVKATGAELLMSRITTALNRFLVPYRFKCLTSKAQYHRADAAVLYVESRHFGLVAGLLEPVHEAVAAHLRPDTCLFARKLARGLGYAEDPAISESFGMNRCRALAAGLLRSWRKGIHGDEARLAELVAGLEEAGIDLDRPHLNPLTRVDFALPFDSAWASS